MMTSGDRTVRRRDVIGSVGAGMVALSGCLGGNGDGGSTPTPTEAAEELGPDEWREKAAEEAAAELEGDEKVLWVNEIRDEPTLKLIQGEYPGVYDVLTDNVEAFTGRTTELRSKYVEEQRSGIENMDVVTLHLTPLLEQGVEFSEIDDLPAFKAQPDELKTPPVFGAFNIMPWSIFYNSELVSSEPETWDDLLAAELAGEKITLDITPNYIVSATVMQKLKSEQYFHDLFKQEPRTMDSGFRITETVAKSNAQVTFLGVVSHALEFNDAGLPIEIPENPNVWINWRMPVAIAKQPAHPWAANLLADFIMRTDDERALEMQSSRPGTLATDLETATSDIITEMFEAGDGDVRMLSDFDQTWEELQDEFNEIRDQYQ